MEDIHTSPYHLTFTTFGSVRAEAGRQAEVAVPMDGRAGKCLVRPGPFVLDCRDALKKGRNTLRIEVTNLPANRIADLDRRGVKWRKFNEINVVDINYKKTSYEGWTPVRSGLNSGIRLVSAGR